MSKNANIDLTNVIQAGPMTQYTVRQELDNGIIELQIRGVESEVKQYLESAKIRIEILPSDEFEKHADRLIEGYQASSEPSIPKRPLLNTLDIKINVVKPEQACTVYINVDPPITPYTTHRYFFSSIDKVAVATESSSGDACMQLYEMLFRWEWRSSGQQQSPTKDIINVTEKRNNGEWYLDISSEDNSQNINYVLEGIFNQVPYEVVAAGSTPSDGNGGGI